MRPRPLGPRPRVLWVPEEVVLRDRESVPLWEGARTVFPGGVGGEQSVPHTREDVSFSLWTVQVIRMASDVDRLLDTSHCIILHLFEARYTVNPLIFAIPLFSRFRDLIKYREY